MNDKMEMDLQNENGNKLNKRKKKETIILFTLFTHLLDI